MHRRKRTVFALVALCFCYYLLTMAGHHVSIDGMLMFQQAKALAFQHSLRMTPPVVWGGTEFMVSKYGIGLSLVYVIVFALLVPLILIRPELRAIPYVPTQGVKAILFDPLYTFSSVIANPAITAATSVIVFYIARRLGLPRKFAVLAALVFGLASPATAYARFDFSQPLASLCLATALLCAMISSQNGSKLAALGTGAALGFGVLTRPDVLAFVPWVALLLVMGAKHGLTRQRLVQLGYMLVPILAGLGTHLLVTYVRFGQLIDHSYGGTSASLGGLGIGALGLMLSPFCGIVWFFPLCLFAPAGLRYLWKQQAIWGLCVIGICLTEFVIFSAWGDWFAGVSWGPRYLLPVLPYLSIGAAAALLSVSRSLRWAWLAALLCSFLASLNGIVIPFLDWFQWLYTNTAGLSNNVRFFLPQASPLLTGWRMGLDLATTDLVWRPAISQLGPIVTVVPLLLLVICMINLHYLIISLRKPTGDKCHML